ENCIIKKDTEYAKLWNDWYKKCDECKYEKISYDKAYKDMQQKIERLQAHLGDRKGKSKDTSSVSDTRNPLSQKLKNKNVELEFQVLNYARENAHLKATYKNLFDSISVSRAQTKTIIASLQNELQSNIYEIAKLRTQLFKNVSNQKDNTLDTSKNTKFVKQPIMENLPKIGKINALLNPVTSNSVSTLQEPKSVNNDKVIAPGMFRINPSKSSREEKHVPNTVSASARTKPITVSQPHVITKKYVNSDLNGLSSTGVENTKTRRPHPRSNTKNDRVPSASKSSRSQNKEAKVEEHHRNLLLFKNNKYISSTCNNINIDFQDDSSKNTKFAKQPIAEILPKIGETNALSKPVTSNSVSKLLVSKGLDNTKTRRPQPRSNTKNDRVPPASKSSRSMNKEVKLEEHHRNLLLSKKNKHSSSACNNSKIDSQDVISKVVCAKLTPGVMLTALMDSSKNTKFAKQPIAEILPKIGETNALSKPVTSNSVSKPPVSKGVNNAKVFNYARENAHLKTTYKNLFDSISVTRAQTKTKIASLQNELQCNIYKNAKLRTQLFKKVSDQNDNTQDSSKNTKFAKQPNVEILSKIGETNALAKPVTSNSVSKPPVSKSVNNAKVIAPGMFRIIPDKVSREAQKVPNTVSASSKTKPITVSQPSVITKKDMNSNLNGLSSTGLDNTKTRRPQRMIGSPLRLRVVEARIKKLK
nr:hypothetical protein [Tanacetum cinerariifolium]